MSDEAGYFRGWSGEDHKVLRRMYKKGAKWADMAERFQVTPAAIRYQLKKLGVERNRRKSRQIVTIEFVVAIDERHGQVQIRPRVVKE